jgi:glycosyltransferase involved in cell wall biosynthesis
LERYGIEHDVITNYPEIMQRPRRGEIYEYTIPFNHTTYVGKFLNMVFATLMMTLLGIKACRRKHYDLLLAPVGEEFCITIPTYITHLVTHIPWTPVIQNVPQGYAVVDSSGQLLRSITKFYEYYRSLGIGALKAFLISCYSFFPKLLLPRIYNKAKAIICISKSLGSYLKSLGIRCEILVVGNGINVNEIVKVEAPRGVHFTGIFVGRFVPEKGIFDVLKVWHKVVKFFPQASLLLVGYADKFQMSAVKNTVNKLRLSENVKVLGPVDQQKEVYMLLKNSGLLIFLSRFEPFGFAIAEAMACGIPVVCYDTPFARELYSCSAVLRVPIDDFDYAADRICDLIKDEDKRRKLGEQALEFVKKRYDLTGVAMREAQAYRMILDLWKQDVMQV